MTRAYISGTGFYVPERVVTNAELATLMNTSDEWITTRTGIKTRHYAAPGQGTLDLAVPAVEQALETASLTVGDIDFIIFATSSPDHYAPGTGCFLQDRMGFGEIGALDIRVQCSGFVYGVSIADQYIRTGSFRNVLVVGAELQSNSLNMTDEGRDVSVIFGDGAGAVVLSATEEDRGVLSTHLHSEGKHAKHLWLEAASSYTQPRFNKEDIDAGRHWLQMDGREVFRHAVVRFPEVILEALEANDIALDQVQLVIPHQANLRITTEVARRLGVPADLIYSNIQRYGNTTAASIPIALAEALREDKIKPGDYIVLAAFGSGFTWAAALIKW